MALAAVATLLPSPFAQHSVASADASVDRLHASNPFFGRVALNASEVDDIVGVDAAAAGNEGVAGCPASSAYDLQLAWTTKLGASVYSTPLVTSAAAGGPTVWATTFVRYAEAVDGHGHELPGWPYAFTRSSFHTSPLAYDVDADGVDELLLLTYDAEAVFLSHRGLPVRGHGFKLPKLKVRKDWFEGLHDIHTTPFKRDAHRLVSHAEEDDDDDATDADGADSDGADGGGAAGGGDAFGGDVGAHGGLSAAAEASFGLFAPMEGDDDVELYEEGGGEGDFVAEVLGDGEPRLAKWALSYEDEETLLALDGQGYVYVDAHALSSPTLADVDGDGHAELVVAISYFFEEGATAKLVRPLRRQPDDGGVEALGGGAGWRALGGGAGWRVLEALHRGCWVEVLGGGRWVEALVAAAALCAARMSL
jgi:hypothetical protein